MSLVHVDRFSDDFRHTSQSGSGENQERWYEKGPTSAALRNLG